MWCNEYKPFLAGIFREVGQIGVAVNGGVEGVTLSAKIHREGATGSLLLSRK